MIQGGGFTEDMSEKSTNKENLHITNGTVHGFR
jgi:hypothetical protein